MKTYSNTLFFAENSEKERIDHFDIRSQFFTHPKKIIWWSQFTFQCPFGAELPGGTNFCVRVRKLPEGRKGLNIKLSA